MGVFDTYRDGDMSVQIKVNHGTMDVYDLHQSCPLEDGIYLGNEGAVAVRDSKVVGVFENVYSKWGDKLATNNLIRSLSAVEKALEDLEASDAVRDPRA